MLSLEKPGISMICGVGVCAYLLKLYTGDEGAKLFLEPYLREVSPTSLFDTTSVPVPGYFLPIAPGRARAHTLTTAPTGHTLYPNRARARGGIYLCTRAHMCLGARCRFGFRSFAFQVLRMSTHVCLYVCTHVCVSVRENI